MEIPQPHRVCGSLFDYFLFFLPPPGDSASGLVGGERERERETASAPRLGCERESRAPRSPPNRQVPATRRRFQPFPRDGRELGGGTRAKKSPTSSGEQLPSPSRCGERGFSPHTRDQRTPPPGTPGRSRPPLFAAPPSRTCRLARPEIGHSHPPTPPPLPGRRREKGAGTLTCPSEPSPPRVPLLPIVGAAAAVIP